MTGKLLSSVAFLTTIFALQNAQSAEVPQALTIDRISIEATDFLDSLEIALPYELKNAKAGETDISVNIGGTIYYFTPKDADQQNILQNLANIGSAALVKLDSADGAIYTLGGKYYGYDAQKLPKSGYSLTEVPSKDAEGLIITKYTKNSDNTLSEKYYKVNISEIGSGDKAVYYKWEKDENENKRLVVSSAEEADVTGRYEKSSYSQIFEGYSKEDAPEVFYGETHDYYGDGGAALLHVSGDYGDITDKLYSGNHYVGTVINNEDEVKNLYLYGGALLNKGTIDSISADFTGNYIVGTSEGNFASQGNTYAYGGAISNVGGNVGSITGNFIGNYVQGSSWAYGGAVYNYYDSTIGNITGNFIGNYAQSTSKDAHGGAIHNYRTIGDITGDFVGNYAQGNTAYGGAIFGDWDAKTGNVTGSFVSNYVQSLSSYAYGGSVYNYGEMGNITGDFVGNYAQSTSSDAKGGAVYNEYHSKIGNITGDFIGNYAQGNAAYGGAISNQNATTIKNITGDFVNNYVRGTSGVTYGGSVANYGIIRNITGDFVGNYAQSSDAAYGGAVFNNYGAEIGNVTGSFIGNYVQSASSEGKGGAIYNTSNSAIKNITGNFIGNYAQSLSSYAYGGAIYNESASTIGNIISDFIDNHTKATSEYTSGGAVYNWNKAIVSNIIGNFINNSAQGTSAGASGGAFSNQGIIDNDIIGNFINNFAQGTFAYGGAIYNFEGAVIHNIEGDFIGNSTWGASADSRGGAIRNVENSTIENIKGDFINNYARSASLDAGGGAVANYDSGAKIGNITGNFRNNYAQTEAESAYARGGAVSNWKNGVIDNITGDFTGNHAQALSSGAQGGAVYNYDNAIIKNIAGNFINNYAQGESEGAYGGAIYNWDGSAIGNITSDFIGNYAKSTSYVAQGGAISNSNSTIKNIINSNFINNYVEGGEDAQGGAIWSDTDILITADNDVSLFSENKANNKSNAIYMYGSVSENVVYDGEETIESAEPVLTLSALNSGKLIINDGIDGFRYDLNIFGDGTGEVVFNNVTSNVNDLNFGEKAVLHLGKNAEIYTANMQIAKSNTISQNMDAAPTIKLDVEVDKAANKVNTGRIYVADDLSGRYSIIVNSLNPDILANKDDAIVPFLFAPNDKEETASSFDIARIIGSPYQWVGGVNVRGEVSGSTWYLNLTDPLSLTVPEVIAGEGLHEAAIEQTRSVVRNVRNKVAAGREYCPRCGVYSAEWDGQKLRNVWVLAQGETATIDKPVKMDADIWGVEAGFDIQNDVNNTLGVFASYRKGEYDLSGKADKIRSNVGSEIDIDSYLAGLYYRYDKNMNWLFATVYGGVQQADAKTDDGIAKFDTDGIEFGASIEAGHTFALSNDLTLDPSLGLYYTQINFDDAKDNVGKEYSWKDIKHLEAELGAKLEKQIDAAKVYVKPSVIQTVTSGDSVKITGLNKLSTYDDQTLGRIGLGGRYGFTDALSVYGWVNYTFGSDYDATAFGVGVNYAW